MKRVKATTRVQRPTVEEMGLNAGKRTRLKRLLYHFGPGNGTLLFLPVDQGLEHGPRDFFANPESLDPDYELRLARDGGYSGIVFQIGIAEKHLGTFAGDVPLVLKLNGKTDIPPDKSPLSPLLASVEDAVRLGADAIGYTLYVGSPIQEADFVQFRGVRQEAERLGMPVIVWAYPRGEAIEARGGRDGLYAVDYAARVSVELGADVVKLNVPKLDREKAKASPKPYNDLDMSEEDAIAKVIRSAGRAMVLFSGGEKVSDDELLKKARSTMAAGATGLIFGRNIWQRPHADAVSITRQMKEIMQEFMA